MAPFGNYTGTTASYDNINFNASTTGWSWGPAYYSLPSRRVRKRNACKICWKVAGWPDRKDLEWFQYQSGRPVHMAEPGEQRLLCGRLRRWLQEGNN